VTLAGAFELSPRKRALLEAMLRRQGFSAAAEERIPRHPETGPAPLSFAQQRLWFLEQLEPGGTVYSMPFALALRGQLVVEGLRRSLEAVVHRHDVLRTTFPVVDGKAVQAVGAPAAFSLPVVDLGGLPSPMREAAGRRLAVAEARRGFDLALGPVIRATLLCLSSREHVLLLTLHHIAADGWSIDVLLAEIGALYPAFLAGAPSPLAELPIQYADFARWQREQLQGERLAALLAPWKLRLREYSGVLTLPTDRSRPAVQTFRGGQCSLTLAGAESEFLRLLGTRQGATPFMTLLTAWMAVLSRWSGQIDLGVGVPVANRNRTEIEGLIGFFSNTLVLRAPFPGELGFAAALARVREASLEADAHQDLPFEKLVEELQPKRSLSLTPLFQVMFVFQGRPKPLPDLPGLEIRPMSPSAEEVKNDLVLTASDGGDRVGLALQFNRDLFEASTAERMLSHLGVLLAAAADDPERRLGDLPLLSTAERWQLLREWNDTRSEERSCGGLHEAFTVQAQRTPDAVAVAWGGERLSYAELNQGASRLARHLRALGVGPEVLVGICLHRSSRMLTAILGVLKAGGAYLPLDPGYPPERLSLMLEDSRAELVITEDGTAVADDAAVRRVSLDREAAAIASQPPSEPPARALAGNLAYVIYTSGSTGRPKGVAIEHRSAVALLDWARQIYAPADLAAVLASTSICFDLSIFEIFLPLATGGCVVLVENVLELLVSRPALPVSLINTVPSLLTELVRAGAVPASVRTINLAGEPFPAALARELARLGTVARIFNLYGPSEDTTYSTFALIDPAREEVPGIGRPIADTRVYLLDRQFQPVPLGAPGDLYLGGSGLARGYLGRTELTAERFVPDPFSGVPGARLYRTGDLARFRLHGELEFLGRSDNQVKVHGFRIEPGEIEAALLEHPAVAAAAVVAREDRSGGLQLAGFVCPRPSVPLRSEEIRAFLAERLPAYMVPVSLTPLPALPLTPNGKVDRHALAASGAGMGPEMPRYAVARNRVEEILVAVWSELLRQQKVGIHDNFFDLGGDSILSIQIVARAARAGVRLTSKQVFKHQTIAELAAAADSSPAFAHSQATVLGSMPLTPVQRWFFELRLADPHHFNQSLLLGTRTPLDPAGLDGALRHLTGHHDALRLRVSGGVVHGAVEDTPILACIDLSALPSELFGLEVERASAMAQTSFDLARGPLIRAALFTPGLGGLGRLLLTAHHLVIDGVSWRILLEDLEAAYLQLDRGEPLALPLKTTSYKEWAERLLAHSESPALSEELPYWLNLGDLPVRSLPLDRPDGENTVASARSVTAALEPEETLSLLRKVVRGHRAQVDEALVAALLLALSGWAGPGPWRVELEGHGREEEIAEDIDLSRTVGWFTSLYPVVLDVAPDTSPGEALERVKRELRTVPRRGLGYGLLRYLSGDPAAAALQGLPRPEVSFNYLGQLDSALAQSALFERVGESAGALHSPRQERPYRLELSAWISGGRLRLAFTYSANLHDRSSIASLLDRVVTALRSLVVDRSLATGATSADFPLARLDERAVEDLLRSREIEDIYELSPLQNGLLFHSLYAPGSEAYLEQVSWTAVGDLDTGALERAWQMAALRHPVLRTSFAWKGLDHPVQVVHPAGGPEWERYDWRELSEDEQRQGLADLAAADRRRGFDLESLPLLRLAVVRVGEDAHRCVWTFHHLLLDGWSLPVLLGEVFALYEAFACGRDLDLAESRPFKEYIAWLGQQDLAAAEAFWRRALAGFTTPTPLPADRRAEVLGEEVWGEVRSQIAESLADGLRSCAQERRVTLNTLLQGAWAVLLGRMSGQQDVLFGATVAGRPASLPGIERMVGLFINTLPVRVKMAASESLPGCSGQLQEFLTEMRQFEFSPLSRVQRWSQVTGGAPLFESLVVFENYPVDSALRSRDLSLRIQDLGVREATTYPLTLALGPGSTFLLKLAYDGRRFERATAGRLLESLRSLLTDLAAHPDRPIGALSLLSPSEEHQLRTEWNDTALDLPEESTVTALFAAQVRRSPGAAALEVEGETLTYAELDRRADGLARRLVRMGGGREVRVGVGMSRSPELVVAMLAVWKAGGVYVPLDLDQPRDRLAWILADAEVAVVISARGAAEELPAGRFRILDAGVDDPAAIREGAGGGLPPADLPEALCYMMYTSGSTGRPKAVMVEHRNLAHVLLASRHALAFNAADRVAVIASFSFDISLLELWSPLTVGGTAVLLTHRPVLSLAEVVAALDRVTVLHAVPALLRQILAHLGSADPGEARYPRLRAILTGGDVVPPELLRETRAVLPGAELHVLYGPTEASIICASHRVDGREERNVIGHGLPNTRLMLLDPEGGPVPMGIPGEIAIGGAGVTRGYWRRPGETAERYRPGESGIHYRTGDLARWLPTGELEFLGRIDHQVKVRGVRVEPGEVEGALTKHTAVAQALVVAAEDGTGDRRLVAYVVLAPGCQTPPEDLRAFLATRLLGPMVPSAFVMLNALPLSPNGKIDRKALPNPFGERPQLQAAYSVPGSEAELALSSLWQETLGVAQIGVADNFFDLGGHSLHLMRIQGKVREIFHLDLPMVDLFRYPTVRSLAAHLVRYGREGASLPAEGSPPGGGEGRGESRRAALLVRQESRRKHVKGLR
jgi:amino acid adenylation domain-containing protein/non-ribosomal peptide synthase protein (TIGR01720 family)